MSIETFRTVAEWDALLGDPYDVANPLSFAQALARDEADAFPHAALDLVRMSGLQEWAIPAALGGRLERLDQPFELLRLLARRDVTVAVIFGGALFSSLPVWIAGTGTQIETVIASLRNGEGGAFCLSERDHGSDLLANQTTAIETGATETTAAKTGAGYLLNGEKWPINGASTARRLMVLANAARPGAAAPAPVLLLLNRAQLDPARVSFSPAERTLGVRGIDLSGIAFADCPVAASSRVGEVGEGVMLALWSLMVSRTLCAALSLGAADTALRETMTFIAGRRLYGAPMIDLPHVQERLLTVMLDLWICEGLSLVATRVLQAAPTEAALWSAVVKYFVPTRLEETIRSLAELLGARCYLRHSNTTSGLFQKVLRDAMLVPLFDGNTATTLGTVAQCLGHPPGSDDGPEPTDALGRLDHRAWFALDEPLPPLDLAGLRHARVGGNYLGAVLRSAPADWHSAEVADAWSELQQALRELDADAAAQRCQLRRGWSRSGSQLEVGRRYCGLHAAAAFLLLWQASRNRLSEVVADAWWLPLIVARARFGTPVDSLSARALPARRALSLLHTQFESGGPFRLMRDARQP